MSRDNLDDWQDALVHDPRGKIWWYNLQFDVTHQNISPEVKDQFLAAVRERLDTLSPYNSPLDLLKISWTAFSLQGVRSPQAEPFSRVLDAHSFSHFNVNWEELGLATSETLKDKVWRRFRKGKIVPERHYRGHMKTGGEYFWGTPTRQLEAVFKELGMESDVPFTDPPEKGDELATEIRNLLGLSYMVEETGLYRIDIPSKYLEGVKVRAPTTLDSSPMCVFLPADEHTPYGCTLHLGKLQEGAEEVVISAVEFTSEYTVTQVGFIKGPLPDADAVWAALESMVVNRLKPQH